MDKIAFVGPRVLAKMLRLQGIDTFPCSHGPEAAAALDQIFNQKEHCLVFITQDLAIEVPDLDQILTNDQINVMIIPDNRGNAELMQEKINKLIKEALGGEINIE